MSKLEELRKRLGVRTFVSGALVLGIAASLFSVDFERGSWLFAPLLGIGLLNSTFGIDIEEMKKNDWKTLIWAVTIGVTLKALIIGVAMYCITGGELRFFIIAIAVAQMDPLSVGALVGSTKLSVPAKNLLNAWAALDDPVTVLMTVMAFVILRLTHIDVGLSFDSIQVTTFGGFGTYTIQNIAFMATVVFFYQLAYANGAKTYAYKLTLTLVFMIGGILVGATWFWMFGVALIGIFMRPNDKAVSERMQKILEIATNVAFAIAAFVIGGLLLAHGISPFRGIALGVCAFGSQVLVVRLLPHRKEMSRSDRLYLAGGHQNGVTACLLALALGTVAIVVPAIVVTHILHIIWDARVDRRLRLS